METPSTDLISVGFAMLPLLRIFDRWTKRPVGRGSSPSISSESTPAPVAPG